MQYLDIVQIIQKKLFQKTPQTRLVFFVVADTLSILAAVWLAFLLRFEGDIPILQWEAMQTVMVLAVMITLPVFYFSRLYSFAWSYVGVDELISLIRSLSISYFFVGLFIFASEEYQFFFGFSRSTLVISYVLTFIFTGGIRLSKRIYLQSALGREDSGNKERTLIIGAGDVGEEILRSILQTSNSPYKPVGFIDDSTYKKGNVIHGVRVLGAIGEIGTIAKEEKIETLIIALPVDDSQSVRVAVENGRKAGLQKIKIIPPLSNIISGELSFRNLRNVQVEDLLGRDPVSLDENLIHEFLRGQTVLITGAAGSIGSELARQVAKFSPLKIAILDQDESGIYQIEKDLHGVSSQISIVSFVANIRDRKKVEEVFLSCQPTVVFHAAAYKHVPLMEEHADEAVKSNVIGTEIVAEAAVKHSVEKFIFVSTDKAVNPSSVMGMTKRIGEMLCQLHNLRGTTKFISVRFGNVLESRGSVIPSFKEQIQRGGPVEVTHPEMKRYFMMTSEACLLVMEAGALGEGGEVFVLDMGKPVAIVDLAKEVIRLSGYQPDKDIPVVFTGVRKGEKMFEDILSAEEGTVATQYQKIFTAKLAPIEESAFFQYLGSLKDKLESGEKQEMLSVLKSYFIKSPSKNS